MKRIWILVAIATCVVTLSGCTCSRHNLQVAQVDYMIEQLAVATDYQSYGSLGSHSSWDREQFDQVRDTIAPARWRTYWKVLDQIETDFFYADGRKVYKIVYRDITLKEHRKRIDTALQNVGFNKERRQKIVDILTSNWSKLDDDYNRERYYDLLYQRMK